MTDFFLSSFRFPPANTLWSMNNVDVLSLYCTPCDASDIHKTVRNLCTRGMFFLSYLRTLNVQRLCTPHTTHTTNHRIKNCVQTFAVQTGSQSSIIQRGQLLCAADHETKKNFGCISEDVPKLIAHRKVTATTVRTDGVHTSSCQACCQLRTDDDDYVDNDIGPSFAIIHHVWVGGFLCVCLSVTALLLLAIRTTEVVVRLPPCTRNHRGCMPVTTHVA